jgi:precorrin-2/cobalt-factor-2 C20-methyltransferase
MTTAKIKEDDGVEKEKPFKQGLFVGVGVGPGDPELITLKAQRFIQQADVISYLCNESGRSQAQTIAAQAIASSTRIDQQFLPVVMPMSENRVLANQSYDRAIKEIIEQLALGKTVAFLCEGDPLFFGSFAYLLERLQNGDKEYNCEIVPGISSVHAAASVLQSPLTMLKESFAVMSGRHSDEQLLSALQQHDSVVIMKAGRARQKIIQALEKSDRVDDANYLEYVGREKEKIIRDIRELPKEAGPYFSLFVITRNTINRSANEYIQR